jgi:hypothetical protein
VSSLDLFYVAIAVAFFLLLDWIVGRVDERNVDARR